VSIEIVIRVAAERAGDVERFVEKYQEVANEDPLLNEVWHAWRDALLDFHSKEPL
jgi:hypothetical protein